MPGLVSESGQTPLVVVSSQDMSLDRFLKGWFDRGADRGCLVALFVASFLVRILYLLESRSSNPFFDAPVVDAQTYLELASRICDGDWLLGPESYWQPPAFPYVLALVLRLVGDEGIYVGMRLLHAVLGAGSVVLTYRLARPLGRPVALLAGSGTALYGPLLYFEGELLAVALEVFLYLALLLFMRRASDGGAPWHWLTCGLLAGAATVTRPTILLFIILAATIALARASGRAARRHLAGRLCLAAAGLFILLLPVTVRNAAVGDEFVLVSANGGINFHIGNHARQDSLVAIHPGIHWDRLVAEPMEAGVAAAGQRSGYFYRRGLQSIAADPIGWVSLLARKSWQLLSGPEIKRNQDPYYARQHSHTLALLMWDRWLSFPHGVLVPLALWGLAASWRRRDSELSLLRQFLGGYGLAVVLFFVTSRYRVPLAPVAFIFAGLAVTDLLARIRNGSWQRPLAVVAGLAIVVNLPSPTASAADAQLQHDLGEVALRRQDFDAAVTHSRQALQLEPGYPSAWHNLAVAALALSDPGQAEAAARQALEIYPARADTRLLLARALLHQNRMGEALTQIERAAPGDSRQTDVHYGAGRLLLQFGQAARAIPYLRKAAVARPAEYWMTYDLGRALHATGALPQARAAFERAARQQPRRAEALSAAGAVALAMGDPVSAGDLLGRALQADAAYAPARVNLGLLDIGAGRLEAGIRHLEQAMPHVDDPVPLWQALARAYTATGQNEKARAAMRAARAKR